MAESFLIALREGFEAALIVAIVLAFVQRRARSEAKWVWIGTGAALALSAIAGLVLHFSIDGLEGVPRMRTFGIICVAAALLLTWMIFWMAKHARHLRGELETRADAALTDGSSLALAFVAFTAVAREGLETALFLISTTTVSNGTDVLIGIVLGLAVAVVLGVGIYHGSKRIDMRRFFMVTGVLIVLFAAGLAAKAVQFFQAAGDLGSVNWAVYDVTGINWLTINTQFGRFLAGIFGWDPRPSLEQVVVYLAFLLPVGAGYLRATRRPKVAPPVQGPPVEAPQHTAA